MAIEWLSLLYGVSLTAALSAPAPSVVIDWRAPEGCPTGPEVQDRVDRQLAEREGTEPARAVALVSRTGDRYELVLQIEGAGGERKLSEPDCDRLADSAATIISLAIQSMDEPATVPEPEPAPEPEPEPEPDLELPGPAPAPQPEPAPIAEPTPPTPRARFGIRALGGAEFGAMPSVAAQAALAGAVFGRRWRAELGGRYLSPTRATVAAGIGGGFQRGSVFGRGCGVLLPGPLEVPLCGGAEIGAIRGDGFGTADATTEHRLWGAFLISAGLMWAPTRRIAVFAEAEGVGVAARPRFVIEGLGSIHRVGSFAVRGSLGVEIRLR